MNWILELLSNPGVATLSNIVLVFALGLATIYYARKVASQTDFMMKDRERRQIVEEVRTVISPFINQLEEHNIQLEEGFYGWYHDKEGVGILGGIRHLYHERDSSWPYRDLVHKNPSLGGKIQEYDKTRIELQKRFREIENRIVTPEFIERCERRATEFNEGRNDPYKVRDDFLKISKIYLNVIANIFDNQRTLEKREMIEPYKDFWNENAELFLKERGREEVRELLEDVENLKNKMLELGGDIVGELEVIREKYRRDYKLAGEELRAAFEGM